MPRARLLPLCAPVFLAACATTSSSGPMAEPPLTRLSIGYAAPPPYQGPQAPSYSYVAPMLPPEIEASVRFTLPSLLATHGVEVAALSRDTPVLWIYIPKLVRVCTEGVVCTNSAHVQAELDGADGRALWSHQTWIDDDGYDAPGRKEMIRRLVTDMARDKVIPAETHVPERSLVVLTEAPDPAIKVRSYDVRFSRSGTGEDFKLISDRNLRESLVPGLDWHAAELLAGGARKAAAATHAVVKSIGPYPAGLASGCDDAAHGSPVVVNADVMSALKRLTAENQASYGLFISSRPLTADDKESPLNEAGLFLADSVDDSGLKFGGTWRGAAHREANLVTPYCAVFYDAAADAAIFQAWRPTRPANVPSKYYEHLDGIGAGFVPSLAGEFDANLADSLGKTLPTFIEQMTP